MSFKEFYHYLAENTLAETQDILKYTKKMFTIKELPDITGSGKMGNIRLQSANRNKDRSDFVKWLGDNDYEFKDKIVSGHSIPVVEVKADNQTLRFIFKPLQGRGSKSDPHELMTACLCLLNKKVTTIDDPDKLISELEEVATTVIGFSKSDIDAFEGSYDDLAKAVSASNKILEKISGKVDKVYITGKAWHKDVEKFKISSGTIKDYNSSDIIVSSGKTFMGVSLKKKSSMNEVDPTLVNNAVENLLGGILSNNELNKIRKAKEDFFTMVFKKETKNNPKDYKEVTAFIKSLQDTKGKAKINSYLKSKDNVFFQTLANVLEDNKDEFITKLLKDAFRVDIKNLKKMNFEFALVVGIGKYNTKGFSIENADYKDIDSTVTVLDDMFGNKDITLERTRNKKQGFEEGATASKIFFTVYSGKDDLINLEVRYKGNYTTTVQPQFFAFVTINFKNLFKK